jgi:O-acetyl-ADP-ribose deacetylase (regulator of RNase III)
MREIQGDLFTSDAPAIGHGVNCRGVMGAGIAVAFREKYPAMYRHYRKMCDAGELQPGGIFAWSARPDEGPWVYNIASQDEPGANATYEWLDQGLRSAVANMVAWGQDRIAIPRIGCGIGGLDWLMVADVIDGVEQDVPGITFDVYYL